MADTLKARYEKMCEGRSAAIRRAREASCLTIPSLIPRSGHNQTSILDTPYQSLGARGVNTLANKLALILLPAGDPFFKFSVDEFTREKLSDESKGTIDEMFAKIERSITRAINISRVRVPLIEALKHLIVGGNVVMQYQGLNDRWRVYHLDQYVQKFSPDHILLDLIIKENTSVGALPEDVRKTCGLTGEKREKEIPIYTGIQRQEDGSYKVWQEINDIKTGREEGTYPDEESLDFKPMGWNWIDGEDYARGHVEELYGDLNSLEQLTKAIVEGSAAAAKVLFFVRPGGQTTIKVLERENGAVVEGDANDVSTLQLEKFNDFRVAKEAIEEIGTRIAFAFLLNQAVQRDAERVTAEEIRRVAEDIDDSLGGIFTQLSEEWQVPAVAFYKRDLERNGVIPSLNDQDVDVQILTGLQALSRSAEVIKIQNFFNLIPEPLVESVFARLDVDEFLKRVGSAVNWEIDDLLLGEEIVQQQQQNQQIQQLLQEAGPDAIKQLLGAAIEQRGNNG